MVSFISFYIFYRWWRGAPNPGLHSETNPHTVNQSPPLDSAPARFLFHRICAEVLALGSHQWDCQSFPFPSLFIHGVKPFFFRSTAKKYVFAEFSPNNQTIKKSTFFKYISSQSFNEFVFFWCLCDAFFTPRVNPLFPSTPD